MTICEKNFVQLLRAAITNEKLPDEIDWEGVWHLARKHHLEGMIYLSAKDTAPENIRAEMSKEYAWLLQRTVLQDHSVKIIERALTEAQIPYAIQKGGVLRNDYPSLFCRFMSDLDFYIKPEDRSLIRDCMESIGGIYRDSESGDEQFLFFGKVGVEFHGRLLYRKTKSGIENYPDWDFVDETRNRLTEEGYALNLIGHVVHDLAGSGPGIRYILDLWIYKHRHQAQPDWNEVDERLKKDCIYEVAHNLLNLSEYLFGDGEENPLMIEMGDYVLQGGLHGDYKREMASQAANRHPLRTQLFRNRTEFENRFPLLKKYPFFLPIAWVLRVFQSLIRHRKTILSWRKSIKNVSVNEAERRRQTLIRFGL